MGNSSGRAKQCLRFRREKPCQEQGFEKDPIEHVAVLGNSTTADSETETKLQLTANGTGYSVEGAGVAKVNGLYARTAELRDGAPCFSNESGIMLFRYQMRRGSRYWYLSESSGDLNSSDGDYFRVLSRTPLPPAKGWTSKACKAGQTALRQPRIDETEPTIAGPTVRLEVVLLSGAYQSPVFAQESWNGQQIKSAISANCGKRTRIAGLMFEGRVVDDQLTTSELGLVDGSVLQAAIGTWDYCIEGCGVLAVNGFYVREEEDRNGASCYANESGILLFRFNFPNGKHYWYLSEREQNLTKSIGDYFRVKTEELLPPLTGWSSDRCPLGRDPTPVLITPEKIEGDT